jgi:hypothetical protein
MHLHPTLTYHSSILPRSIPTPGLLDSAVSGAHYSGVESVTERRRSVRAHSISRDGGAGALPNSPARRQSALPAIPNPLHLAVVDDLKDVRCCRLSFPSLFENVKGWRVLMIGLCGYI